MHNGEESNLTLSAQCQLLKHVNHLISGIFHLKFKPQVLLEGVGEKRVPISLLSSVKHVLT